FGFAFCEEEIEAALARAAVEQGSFKVRLTLSKDGRITTETSSVKAYDRQRVALATQAVDSSDRFLFHKTTKRDFYNAQLAAQPGCNDVIFWNEKGEVTESTIANVVVQI